MSFDLSNHQIWLPNLHQTWEDLRPSCPKRTTLGKFTLEILPPEWTDFVEFHVQELGCDYCRANLLELSEEMDANENERTSSFFRSNSFFSRRSVFWQGHRLTEATVL